MLILSAWKIVNVFGYHIRGLLLLFYLYNRKELISRVAKSEGYSKVIVAETCTRLSAAILSNMAQGKGAHIAYDTVTHS